MEGVTLRLRPGDKSAQQVADEIRAAGTINYTDATGSTVNVTVDDVSVGDVG
jgi:hypothetical protein